MSDANRVGLAYVVESTYGVTPSGPPTLKNLRWVNESLKQRTGSVTSQEVRADRQVSDLVRTELSAGGDISVELSYGAYDELFEYALESDATWTTAVDFTVNSATINITIAASGSNFTLTRASGSWITDGLSATTSPGKWMRFSAMTLAANNGYAKVVSVTATVLTVSSLAMSATTQSSGTVSFRQMAEIKNGVLLKSLAIEKSFQDLSNTFSILNGMCIDTLALDASIGSILKGTIGFLGKKEASATATAGTGTNTAAPTNAVMNTIDNITGIFQGGAAFAITKLTLELKNNLRARQQIGTLGAISIGTGTVAVTGSIEAYFTSQAQLDLYRNWTKTSLAVKLIDSASNAYVIDMPEVILSDGEAVGGGINTDVMAKFTFTAFMDPTELTTLRIARSPNP